MRHQTSRKEISEAEKLSAEIKQIASKAGANLVGIVLPRVIDDLPKVWVGFKEIQNYTKKAADIMRDAKSIIVMGYHIWDNALELAILRGERWTYPEYFALKTLALEVIAYLEKKGNEAIITNSLSYKRLAQLAGFGNYGKNALIINSEYGPWMRFAVVLTNAEMKSDEPFEKDLCRNCENCLRACPVGALVPYKVDYAKCLVGIHLIDKENFERNKKWRRFEPSVTKNSHFMCMECQKACRYGREMRRI